MIMAATQTMLAANTPATKPLSEEASALPNLKRNVRGSLEIKSLIFPMLLL
jgi:hypothetical protein